MTLALCPGSFDPTTRGHLDIFIRTLSFCDELIIGLGVNSTKGYLFSDAQRQILLRDALLEVQAPMERIRIMTIPGLLANFCRDQQIDVVVKGVRNSLDLEHEMPMAEANRALCAVETILLPSAPNLGLVSSSIVKEVALLGGDISPYVTKNVALALAQERELLG
ncbi:MAG: pantetheine-phosphate adenylyltransferase [Actinomycetaceae bacterium]|nr:pantetheine-phosphate adenylyltransferase [Actinomycetaceae bacterium]